MVLAVLEVIYILPLPLTPPIAFPLYITYSIPIPISLASPLPVSLSRPLPLANDLASAFAIPVSSVQPHPSCRPCSPL
jgi:hypothetical protein